MNCMRLLVVSKSVFFFGTSVFKSFGRFVNMSVIGLCREVLTYQLCVTSSMCTLSYWLRYPISPSPRSSDVLLVTSFTSATRWLSRTARGPLSKFRVGFHFGIVI